MHVQQEVQGHLCPEEDLDDPQVKFRNTAVIEGTFHDGVDRVIGHHVLLDVRALPTFLLDHSLLLIDHEVSGALFDCSWFEVEGSEHTEVRRSNDIDLVVVVFGIKGKVALSDGHFVQVP